MCSSDLDAAVFGALNRVEAGVDVLLQRYPDLKVIPIITTCSTETIGDDIDGSVLKMNSGLLKQKYPNRDIYLVPIHTPSYNGSMITGYDNAILAFVQTLAKKSIPTKKMNLIPGWCNPGDVKEIKHYLKKMGVKVNVLPDIQCFDSPIMPDKKTFTHGKTPVEDFINAANSIGTIALNKYEGSRAACYLEDEFNVPAIVGPSPIGIKNTDKFLQNVKKLTGKEIPESLVEERGRAIDALADLTHMFFANKKVAIYGAPDLVIGLAEFCLEVELEPVLLLLGDDHVNYKKDPRLLAMKDNVDFDLEVICNAYLFEL